jgi:SAM-dependent methyltransferase
MQQPSSAASAGEPAAAIVDLVQKSTMLQAVFVAAELKIADLLARGCNGVDELAAATGAHAQSLHRLLRALASLGFCIERDDGVFVLGPMSGTLRSDAPDSLRSWIRWSAKYQWPVWGNLLHSVRTGESARKLVTGSDGFGPLERDPEAAAVFNGAMVELTRLVADEVMGVCDFAGMQRIVDVGGGHGALIAAVLAANPAVQGVLFDRPHAIEGAKTYLNKLGVARRCELVAGDFFVSVPPGADAYLLKNIIHDWDDERSTILLRNCAHALAPSGRLLLIERVMPSRLDASSRQRAAAWFDLTMLLATGGRQRTETEFRALLSASGFLLTKVTPTAGDHSILEAVPAER